MSRLFAVYALTLLFLGAGPEALASDSQTPALLSPAQLRQDLSFIQDTLARTHPDINLSADAAELKATFNRIERDLIQPLTRDQAWRQFALLNPVFADAHVSVISPDPQSQTNELIRSGNGLFPFEVSIDLLGRVYVLSELGGGPSSEARASIEKVNGVPIQEVTPPCQYDLRHLPLRNQ